jgi:hypothetical protein
MMNYDVASKSEGFHPGSDPGKNDGMKARNMIRKLSSLCKNSENRACRFNADQKKGYETYGTHHY